MPRNPLPRTYPLLRPRDGRDARRALTREQDLRRRCQRRLRDPLPARWSISRAMKCASASTGALAPSRTGALSRRPNHPVAEDAGQSTNSRWCGNPPALKPPLSRPHPHASDVSPIHLSADAGDPIASAGAPARRTAGARYHRSGAILDDEAALAILHPAPLHRRAIVARRFRYRLFLADLSAALSFDKIKIDRASQSIIDAG